MIVNANNAKKLRIGINNMNVMIDKFLDNAMVTVMHMIAAVKKLL